MLFRVNRVSSTGGGGGGGGAKIFMLIHKVYIAILIERNVIPSLIEYWRISQQ